MRKLLFVLVAVTLLLLYGCADQIVVIDPTASNTPDMGTQPTEQTNQIDWSGYSDYQLMELTLNSESNEFRSLSAVHLSGEVWMEYMLEHCDPFRALMLRDTAEESLKQHSFELVTNCSNAFTAENFAELVVAVVPEMKEELHEYLSSAGSEFEIPVS